jgi:hypothetical protein
MMRRLCGFALGLFTLAISACGGDDAPSAPADGGAGVGGRGGASGGSAGASGSGAGGASGTGVGGAAGTSGGSGTSGSGGSSGNSAGSSGSGGSGGNSGTAGSSGTNGASGSAGTGGAPSVACAAFPGATGTTLRVTPAGARELHATVGAAQSGTTLLLEDGTYTITAPLWFRTAGVTLRSLSNDATKVIIDANYAVNETIAIQASNVTVAHVTLTRAVDHLVHVSPPDGTNNVNGTVLYGIRFIDGGEQFVKVNPNASRMAYADQGRVECSSFELTNAGRPHIEPNPGGCYTGGIDVHGGWDWVVRNNRFASIYCDNGSLPEHAVHFWTGSRGTLVENNVITNCGRGVGFGLGDTRGERVYPDRPYNGALLGHYDGVIRNNVIWANNQFYDTGIELHVTKRPVVLHNTVVHGSGATRFFRSIDYRFADTDVVILNNLTLGIAPRDGAQGMVVDNFNTTPLDYFVDAAGLDFHLRPSAAQAIDRGQVRSESGIDIDGQAHDQGAPDLGADEYRP